MFFKTPMSKLIQTNSTTNIELIYSIIWGFCKSLKENMFYNPKLSHIWGQNANISEFYAANVARLYAKLTSLFAKKCVITQRYTLFASLVKPVLYFYNRFFNIHKKHISKYTRILTILNVP